MKEWLLRQLKKKARIYIMPTRMGGYLNGLIFLMFLLSVGYSNNLLLIFTLFLFGLNLIWVIQTHFHLHALKHDSIQIEDGHAGENMLITINWKKVPEGPHKWELQIDDTKIKGLEDTEKNSVGQMNFPKRGVLNFYYLKIKSEMPFGLYTSWIYFPIRIRAWVYPAKLKNAQIIPSRSSQDNGEHSSLRSGPHDVWNLGPYQGEESRKISWKHYARSGELVVKEGEELTNPVIHFRVSSHLENKELYLSTLTTQMVQCTQSEIPFDLETPEKKISVGMGQKHLTDCLRELSQC
jgi:uncharacterized protein (DUF58 family)